MLLVILISLGFLFSLAGAVLIFKNNSKGLTRFGTFNGPWVDKTILFRARLGLVLLVLGIVMQFVGGDSKLIYLKQDIMRGFFLENQRNGRMSHHAN